MQYLPQPQYFAELLQDDTLEIDGFENFVKQSYRNRCRILTANGIDSLTVPVSGVGKKILAKDIKIDHSQKWLTRHCRAIQSAYGKAPFYEYYADDLFTIIKKQHKFLFDLSNDLLTQCLEFLQLSVALNFTTGYSDFKNMPENDLRSKINPKKNPNDINTYNQVAYQQVFGNDFVDNLSVIDLVFCQGPQAGAIIESGIVKKRQ